MNISNLQGKPKISLVSILAIVTLSAGLGFAALYFNGSRADSEKVGVVDSRSTIFNLASATCKKNNPEFRATQDQVELKDNFARLIAWCGESGGYGKPTTYIYKQSGSVWQEVFAGDHDKLSQDIINQSGIPAELAAQE